MKLPNGRRKDALHEINCRSHWKEVFHKSWGCLSKEGCKLFTLTDYSMHLVFIIIMIKENMKRKASTTMPNMSLAENTDGQIQV